MKNLTYVFISFFLLSGCASKLTVTSEPPKTYDLENSRVYEATYDDVWKTVVDVIGTSFYVIENVEKDSGILGISFSAKNPQEVIDCGVVKDNGTIAGKKHNATFPGAISQITRVMVLPNGIPVQALRTLTLQGKSNILVKKLSSTQTEVTINTKYMAELNYSGTEYVVVGFNSVPRPFSFSQDFDFTTNETGTNGTNGLTCKSKLTLENGILDKISTNLK